MYLWEGDRRYRLFLRTAVDVVHGNEYVAEGIYAQKAIDEIGDPDQGKNGYPLQSSCERVVRMAWNELPFDEVDPTGLGCERQGETVSGQARIPGYADTARYIRGEQRRFRDSQERAPRPRRRMFPKSLFRRKNNGLF